MDSKVGEHFDGRTKMDVKKRRDRICLLFVFGGVFCGVNDGGSVCDYLVGS